jgi:pimeloyl-ACP methyl ester carboxylesterase
MHHLCTQLSLETSHGQVEFCDVGQGLPVLYFHGTGAGNDAAVLLEQELLAAGCRLVIPHRPGYYGTPLGDAGSTDYCADLSSALLDRLQLGRVAVVGTSGGGMPAAAFARRYPQRTAALVMQCARSHRWDDGRWLPQGLQRTLFLFPPPSFLAGAAVDQAPPGWQAVSVDAATTGLIDG